MNSQSSQTQFKLIIMKLQNLNTNNKKIAYNMSEYLSSPTRI